MVEQNQVWVGSEDSVIYIINIHSMSCNKQLSDHRTSVTGLVQGSTVAPRYHGALGRQPWCPEGRAQDGCGRLAVGPGSACREKRVWEEARWPSCLFWSWAQRSTVSGSWCVASLGFGSSGRGPGVQTLHAVFRLHVARSVSPSVQMSPSYQDAGLTGSGSTLLIAF